MLVRIFVALTSIARPNSRQSFSRSSLVTVSVAAHLFHPIVVRRFWSDRESFASRVSTSRVATQFFRLRHRPLLIVDRCPYTASTPPRTDGNRSRSTVHAMRLYIQLFSEYHTEVDQPSFFDLLTAFVCCFAHR